MFFLKLMSVYKQYHKIMKITLAILTKFKIYPQRVEKIQKKCYTTNVVQVVFNNKRGRKDLHNYKYFCKVKSIIMFCRPNDVLFFDGIRVKYFKEC